MKKFLLIDNYTNYSYDDNDLTSNVFVVGDYDTIEQCLEACENEIENQAKENAKAVCEDDQEKQEYIEAYCCDAMLFGVVDEDFARPGANRYVMEHWADGGSYKLENQFMVVRIA